MANGVIISNLLSDMIDYPVTPSITDPEILPGAGNIPSCTNATARFEDASKLRVSKSI